MKYLNPAFWAKQPTDILCVDDGSDVISDSPPLHPEFVYRPATFIPKVITYRTSDREKRLEGALTVGTVSEGDWGRLLEVHGGSSHVGFVLVVTGEFHRSAVLPDSVHLMNAISNPEVKPKDILQHKMLKVLTFDRDLYVVTKTRWFRSHANPKHLTFSKDEK